VIAGKHDHPTRLDTWGLLAEFVGVQARGLPRRRQDGGLIELPTRGGETALVAALPWAPPGRIVEALTLARDQTLARQQYAAAVQQMLAQLAEGFRPDAVNLVVAHSHIAGAKGSGSERVTTMGDEWAATAQSLPTTAQYVALGHIHRPQRVMAAASHTEFAGSPLQLDFGEVNEEKSFVVIEAVPGRPPRVERVPYEGGRALGHWEGTLPELERDAENLRRFGYLRVKVALDSPMPSLNRRARQILPNIVVVDAVLPGGSVTGGDLEADHRPRPAPVDQFRAFYERHHQRAPKPPTLDLFNELYLSASE
jgi:exonuclease SbcD